MLCDDVLRIALEERPDDLDEEFVANLRRARRFFLQPHWVATAENLATASPEAIEHSRDYLCLPDSVCWIEWRMEDLRFAFFFVGVGDGVQLAAGHLWYQDAARGLSIENVMFDPAGDGPLLQVSPTNPLGAAQVALIERLGPWLGAALVVLNTPRLCRSREIDHKKLNAKRARSGKPPLLSYTEVHLNIDRMAEPGVPGGDGGAGVALHRVRTFLRIKRGKGEIVRPHWRGHPRYGVKLHRYIAKREEDNELHASQLCKPPCTPVKQLLGDSLPPELANDPSLQRHLDRMEARGG